MRVRHTGGKIVKFALGRFGYELCSVNGNRVDWSIQSALHRRAASGLEIKTVIDVGASDGQWSRIAQQYFPQAFYFLVEANEVHASGLQQLKAQNANVDYILAAAGDSIGQIYFDATDPFGGQASHSPGTSDQIVVTVTTIDEQVRRRSLRPPFLLKLDTHGFEVPILKGAEETLKKTNLIVMETYNFSLGPDSLRFWEMCTLLEKFGFRPVDFCDPFHRPRDQAFWQMDLFFVSAANREFETNAYE